MKQWSRLQGENASVAGVACAVQPDAVNDRSTILNYDARSRLKSEDNFKD